MTKKIEKLKDTEKAFELTLKTARVFNKKKRLILEDEIKSVDHFSIVRDYTITLEHGGEIWLDSGIIKMIVEHEHDENTND